MSFKDVQDTLKSYGLDDRIHTFDKLTATVDEAAQALNTSPNQIAKTMAFQLKDFPIVIVMEGGSKISNQKFREVFNQRATMVKAKDLESEIGHPVGGVCPFALKDDVRLYFDETLKKHQIVFTAAGTETTTVKLTLDELENIVKDFKWIDVAK